MSNFTIWANARTVKELEDGSNAMGYHHTARAIPLLARFDQRAPGILRFSLVGLARVLFFGLLLYLAIRLTARAAPFLILSPRRAVAQYLGDGWSIGWMVINSALTILMLYGSQAMQNELQFFERINTVLDTTSDSWKVVNGVVRFWTGLLLAVFVFVALGPVAIGAIGIVRWTLAQLAFVAVEIQLLENGWAYGVGAVVLLFWLGWRYVRALREDKNNTRGFTMLVLWLVGMWLWAFRGEYSTTMFDFAPIVPRPAVLNWLESTDRVQWLYLFNGLWLRPQIALFTWLALFLAYPIGYAPRLVRMPTHLLHHLLLAVNYVGRLAHLRLTIWDRLGEKRKRNHRQTKGAGWTTVCKQHLKRLVLHSERLAYGRWVHYAACPDCHDDTDVWVGVEARALHFDVGATSERHLHNGTLLGNGTAWVEQHRGIDEATAVEIWFDSVVIGNVDQVVIEEFLTVFGGISADKPLNQLSAHLLPNNNISDNMLRRLQAELASVNTNFQLTTPACPSAFQAQVRAQAQQVRGRRNVGYALGTAVRYGSLLLILWLGWQLWRGQGMLPFVAQWVS